jgi:hypothetical protein
MLNTFSALFASSSEAKRHSSKIAEEHPKETLYLPIIMR